MKKTLSGILVFAMLSACLNITVAANNTENEKIWAQTDFNMENTSATQITTGIPGSGITKITTTPDATSGSEIKNGAFVYTQRPDANKANWGNPSYILFENSITRDALVAGGYENVTIEYDLTVTGEDNTAGMTLNFLYLNAGLDTSSTFIDMRYNMSDNPGKFSIVKWVSTDTTNVHLPTQIGNAGKKRIKIVTDLVQKNKNGNNYCDYDFYIDGTKIGTYQTRSRNSSTIARMVIADMAGAISANTTRTITLDNLKIYSRKPNAYLESISVKDGSNKVKVNESFTLKFENSTQKAIDQSSIYDAVSLNLKDGDTLSNVTYTVTDNGDNSFNVTPSPNLLYDRDYVLTIDETLFTAANGLPIISLLDTDTINFKTKTQYLAIENVTYSGNKAKLPWTGAIISFEFDAALADTVSASNVTVTPAPPAGVSVSIDENVIDLTFPTLAIGTDYTVTLTGLIDEDLTPMQADYVETFSTDPSAFSPRPVDNTNKPFTVLQNDNTLTVSGTVKVFDRYKNETVTMVIVERGSGNKLEQGIINSSAITAETIDLVNKSINKVVKINSALIADKSLRAYFYGLGFEDVYYFDFDFKSDSSVTSFLNTVASQTTTAGMLGVIEANADYLGVDTTYEGLGNSQIVMKKIIDDAPTTTQGIRDSFENGMVLLRAVTKINNAQRVLTNDSNTGFDDVINAVAGDLGISSEKLTEYNALSEEDKRQVAAAIVPLSTTAQYTSVEQLSIDFSAAIISALADNVPTQNKPQGGGNNNGGLPGIGAIVSTQQGISPSSASSFTMKPVVRDMNFNDISNVSWAKNSILDLANRGIIDGVSETEFNPDANITREQFIKIVMGAFNFTTSGRPVTYGDVSDDEWYFPYISAATQNGLITGINDKEFGVGMPITRQDMAVILHRIITKLEIVIKNEEEPQFADNDQIADYAKKAVASFSATGLINGVGDNNYNPRGNATRAQAAHLIYSIASYCTGR